VTAPLDIDPVPAAPLAAVAGQAKAIEGRSLGQIAWMRLKRDRVALAGGVVIIFLVLVAIFADFLTTQDPNEFNPDLVDPLLGGPPKGAFGGISLDHWFGVEPINGRDLFSRMVKGAQVSLLIALSATVVSIVLGAVAGVTAGYFGGRIDNAISRVMDLLLAFPVLIFSIALLSVAEDIPRVALLIGVIGFFGWPYIGRILRGQTLSLREREFVDAARSLGASNAHIIFRQLLPNLYAPLLVYATLIIPTNILQEAALSYLGVGVQPPTPSWGKTLSDSVQWASTDPMYMVVPGTILFVTVLAFNLLGDGLRDALDPRASRG
jgi:peptide/nickel transport system permease protein